MKSTKSLFPELVVDFPPAAGRTEPTVWIRRLVVVDRREPDIEPIRTISFRRGLNIIATEPPRTDDTRPVGHNVGKTLLTRLIRYCLGEQYLATESVRKSLARVLPGGYVLAEVAVNTVCWVVARPVGENPSGEAWACQADDWRTLLGSVRDAEKFPVFVEALEQATVSNFAEMTLPHQERPIRWHDLLAWLSRDQYCRYRHPLEWRARHTESGTVDLHPEDASLLIRAVMDLLDAQEKSLVARHRKLLRDKNAKSATAKKTEGGLAKTRDFLEQRLQMEITTLGDDLFAAAAKQQAEARKLRLEQDLKDMSEQSPLADLNRQLRDAEDAVTRKEEELQVRLSDRQIAEGNLRSSQEASDEDFAASFGDLAIGCTLPPGQCPLKDPTRKPGERNPLREFVVNEKTVELQKLDQQTAELRTQLQELRQASIAAKDARDQEQANFDTERERIEMDLVRAKALIEEADGYCQSLQANQQITQELAQIESQVEESRAAHHAARGQVAGRQRTLNAHFNRVLSALVGARSQGRIDIDMRGLHLAVDGEDATPGEALATSCAIGLDLACLSASISGLGQLPRLLIHDSPREGDLELHIYGRLFDFVRVLEAAYGDREPAFQYIVTTTTPPPEEFNDDHFVRARLHARDKSGLLLRAQF